MYLIGGGGCASVYSHRVSHCKVCQVVMEMKHQSFALQLKHLSFTQNLKSGSCVSTAGSGSRGQSRNSETA